MAARLAPGAHPSEAESDAKVLVVGAGPAGLEAATVARAARATRSCSPRPPARSAAGWNARRRLPGLAEWARVADHRVTQLAKLPNVLVTLESPMTADEIVGYDFTPRGGGHRVPMACDGLGSWHSRPVFDRCARPPTTCSTGADRRDNGSTVFDDEHYYLGGVLAELLAKEGFRGHAGHPRGPRVGMDREHHGAGPASTAGWWRQGSTAHEHRRHGPRRRCRCAG